jgi:hypothetical protein
VDAVLSAEDVLGAGDVVVGGVVTGVVTGVVVVGGCVTRSVAGGAGSEVDVLTLDGEVAEEQVAEFVATPFVPAPAVCPTAGAKGGATYLAAIPPVS